MSGRTLLSWAVAPLAAAGCSPIVVAVPSGLRVAALEALAGVDAVVVAGGATRQESVARGLEQIDAELIAVHDGARPFATPALVRRVLDAAAATGAAVCALPVDETIKRVERDVVVGTVPRASLWSIQTPQAFQAAVLRAAHAAAVESGFTGTDDAQLVERNGGEVAIVRGSRVNVKVTYPEDFALAEALASLLA